VILLDKLVWHFNKDDNYTVKSGYVLYMRGMQDGLFGGRALGSSSMSSSPVVGFSTIWKLRVQPKLGHFMWQCVHNILPGVANLLRRLRVRDGMCACGDAEESVIHALFTCRFVVPVWHFSPLRIDTLEFCGDYFDNWRNTGFF
jgi:hypothetical protein